MGCHALLQGIFPTEGLNLGLPHCRQILYQLSHQGICALGGGVCMCVFFFVRPKTRPTSLMASDLLPFLTVLLPPASPPSTHDLVSVSCLSWMLPGLP